MATYPLEKILADYASGKMDVEMTLGHSLQHIGQLHAGQSAAHADRQAWHKQVNLIEQTISRWQEDLAALKRSVGTLQTAFDSLATHAKTPPRSQVQDVPSKSSEKPASDH